MRYSEYVDSAELVNFTPTRVPARFTGWISAWRVLGASHGYKKMCRVVNGTLTHTCIG